MGISVVRALDGARLPVEVLADVEVSAIVASLSALPLVARPAEVFHGRVGGVGYAIYLLPFGPADVAKPDFARAWPHCEAEGVPEPVGDDAAGAVAVVERVSRERVTGRGVHPKYRPVEGDRISAGAQILAAQRPSLCCRHSERGPYPPGRFSTGVERVTALSV